MPKFEGIQIECDLCRKISFVPRADYPLSVFEFDYGTDGTGPSLKIATVCMRCVNRIREWVPSAPASARPAKGGA